MGRLISYDNVVEEKISAILKEKTQHFGLIIGQVCLIYDKSDLFVIWPIKIKDDCFYKI